MSENFANRSQRRQAQRTESKRQRKEEKKMMKVAPHGGKYNSKKSHKVVPYNPIGKQEQKLSSLPPVMMSAPIAINNLNDAVSALDTNEKEHENFIALDKQDEPQSDDLTNEVIVIGQQEYETTLGIKDHAENLLADTNEETQELEENKQEEPEEEHQELIAIVPTNIATITVPAQEPEVKEKEEKITDEKIEELTVIPDNSVKAIGAPKQIVQEEVLPTPSVSDKTLPSLFNTSVSSMSSRTSSDKKMVSKNIITRLFKHSNKSATSATTTTAISAAATKTEDPSNTTGEKKQKKVKAWKIWKNL